jgi:nitrate/TMAO reductase-like tetraheme cytochrome c subunit
MTHRRRLSPARILLTVGILLVISGMAMIAQAAQGEQPTPAVTPEASAEPAQPSTASVDTAKPSDGYCLLCHSQPGRSLTLPSGETLSLTIDEHVLADSVHGVGNPKGALACVDCHADQRFPHKPVAAQSIREYQLERYATCRNCHEEQYTKSQDSVHAEAIKAGTLEAATCADCHGSHDIQKPDVPRQRISLTCGKCHGAIFEQYRNSVHGAALFTENNPDVPTCIDCHGVHNINDPTTTLFRVRSPELCAKCHANQQLMAKYNITANVFDSYLTDFHGKTVALFEQQDPNVATNKAVCFDCHGVHDIARVDANNSRVIRENLVTTCRQCHPDATADFPAAWVGHFPPTLESHPLLFVVNTFYKILIPTVIGAFVFLVLTDIIRRIRQRGGRHTKAGGQS